MSRMRKGENWCCETAELQPERLVAATGPVTTTGDVYEFGSSSGSAMHIIRTTPISAVGYPSPEASADSIHFIIHPLTRRPPPRCR